MVSLARQERELQELKRLENHPHSFNEQGYCRVCGDRESTEVLNYIGWPTNTWFQNRRKEVNRRG